MRKRGSWHLAVGWQAGAGGTVFSPAALKVVDVVQTLSAAGSKSRPPWLRLPPENPKRAHVVRQRGRVSAQESRRHMCTGSISERLLGPGAGQMDARYASITAMQRSATQRNAQTSSRPAISRQQAWPSRTMPLWVQRWARDLPFSLLLFGGCISVSFFLQCCSRHGVISTEEMTAVDGLK